MSLPTPKRTSVHGVTFVRSKHGNLYRSGMVLASKQAAQLTDTGDIGDNPRRAEANQSDISSDEGNGAETDGEDVDSDDLADDLIEGVDDLGRQALAEQHDFVGF
ncbi:MAG: hypothetical protein Q9211_000786 [Gyalolechia sp. 1 TL-2023]